jgi:hypothetical protein
MIPKIQKLVSPDIIAIDSQDARLVMADKKETRTIVDHTAMQTQGSADSQESIALVLANPDDIATADHSAVIKAAWQKKAAIDAARQSLKPKLAAAKREAADKILANIKPVHDAEMKKLMQGLSVATEAWIAVFGLSRDLVDHGVGWRNQVCDLVPELTELFGVPNAYSPLAGLLLAAVKAKYLSALPKEFRV